jgi:hypothetical protein
MKEFGKFSSIFWNYGIILAKGGNVLEYKAKVQASSKPMCSRITITKIVPPMQKKRNNLLLVYVNILSV